MNKLFELLISSWKLLKSNYSRFVIFFIFQCLIQLLSPLGEIYGIGPGSVPAVWLELLVAALSIWNFTYLLHILMDIKAGNDSESIELFIQATYDTPAFFLYSLIYGLTIALGCILFVIPGFFFLIFNYFAPLASVVDPDSDNGDDSYFSYSRKLVKPHWGKVIGFLLILLVFNTFLPSLLVLPALKEIRLSLDMITIPIEVVLVLIADILAFELYNFLKEDFSSSDEKEE